MCLAAIAVDPNPHWRLVIAANRDEFRNRPADPLARWADDSGIIAGRDQIGGGTWLGLTEAGRLALLTNYRAPERIDPARPSRGGLIVALLRGTNPDALALDAYNPLNLLLVTPAGAQAWSNCPTVHGGPLQPGIHGLSNGPLDPPWIKTSRTMAALAAWLDGDPAQDLEALFAALRDTTPAPDGGTDTGPLAHLSAPYVAGADYGTRCSTLVTVDARGCGRIVERRFDAAGGVTGQTAIAFRWPDRG